MSTFLTKIVHFSPVEVENFIRNLKVFFLRSGIFLRNFKVFFLHRAGKIPLISVYLKGRSGEEVGGGGGGDELKLGGVVAHSIEMICRRLKLGGVVAHSIEMICRRLMFLYVHL